jgi:hypothetical protein
MGSGGGGTFNVVEEREPDQMKTGYDVVDIGRRRDEMG